LVHLVLKSDYANGLFGFAKPCLPSIIKEEQTATCYVSRSRGLSGTVTVEWMINSTGNGNDFVQNTGNLTFLSGEEEKVREINFTLKKLYMILQHYIFGFVFKS